jgi:DNA-binding IclR family transcriptional regulator
VVLGMHSFGIAIRNAKGAPFASLTVSGASDDPSAVPNSQSDDAARGERIRIGKRMPLSPI